MYTLVGFSILISLCKNYLIPEHFYHLLQRNPIHIRSHCHSPLTLHLPPAPPLPQLLATTNLLSVSMDLPILACQDSFISRHASTLHSFYGWITSHCMDVLHTVYPSGQGFLQSLCLHLHSEVIRADDGQFQTLFLNLLLALLCCFAYSSVYTQFQVSRPQKLTVKFLSMWF